MALPYEMIQGIASRNFTVAACLPSQLGETCIWLRNPTNDAAVWGAGRKCITVAFIILQQVMSFVSDAIRYPQAGV